MTSFFERKRKKIEELNKNKDNNNEQETKGYDREKKEGNSEKKRRVFLSNDDEGGSKRIITPSLTKSKKGDGTTTISKEKTGLYDSSVGKRVSLKEQVTFLANYKEKFNKVLKMLSYYFIVLISIFFIMNFTDYFSYKTIFGSNQVALNKGIVNSKSKNNNVNSFVHDKYLQTYDKYKDFLGLNIKAGKISGYFCIDLDGVIKRLSLSDIKNKLRNIKINSNDVYNRKSINDITTLLLAKVYAKCGRDSNIYRIKYNDVYNSNVVTDILNIITSGKDEDNVYKLYNYALIKENNGNIIDDGKGKKLSESIKEIAETFYENVYEQIKEKNTLSNLDQIVYSADNILLSSNIKINLFKNEISDIKTWYDGNDNLGFFSKLSWISTDLYDLSAFNIKGTFKYLFDSILYSLPFVSFVFLNLSSIIITGILTIFLFFLLDILPMSMLALGSYINIESIVFYIINFFYTLIYYFVEIMVVIFIISKIIGFLINVI